MATAVSYRAASSSSSFFRLSFVRNLSISAPSAGGASPAAKAPPPPNQGKTKKNKNLIEVANFLPNWGIGYHMAKTHWTGISYEITKINLYKDGRHGKAWGIAHRDGVPIADAPKKISGVHKRCWRYLTNVKKAEASATAPTPEVQAA